MFFWFWASGRATYRAPGTGRRRLRRRPPGTSPASACRSPGRRPRTTSAMSFWFWASGRAVPGAWSRPSPPTAPPSGNVPASACRSPGPGRRTTSAMPFRILGERESDAEYLEQAIAACRAALQELPREHVPLAWAGTQNNLGNALGILGGLESNAEHLKQAIAAYRAALPGTHPRARAARLGHDAEQPRQCPCGTWRKLESDAEHLEQAIAAYRAALQERTRERVPLDWATTQNNLGNVLLVLGKRESDVPSAWSRPSPPTAPPFRNVPASACRSLGPMTQNNLGNVLVASWAGWRATPRTWNRPSPPTAPPFRSVPASASRSPGPRRRTTSAMSFWPWASGREETIAEQSALSRPWLLTPKRLRSALASVCQSTGP